ncbi:DUF7344 domain-containing protein [Haloprofundus salilacus]|uniref:DUF7344 domain-containing protein n=1 Tax=Haloprofundus salilacus TaxID=2876190 RepID=UPI001CCBD6C3|nr:hypothetical protein [Haloprofundus salilacus]
MDEEPEQSEQSEQSESGQAQQRAVDNYIQTVQPPPADILEMDFVFDALAHPRRRYILYSLLSKSRWSLTELATKLVAWEHGIPEEDISNFDRNEMYTSLYHSHIPKLMELDIVEFNDGEVEETIVADFNAIQVLSVLQGAGASLDSAQEIHARRDYHGG